MTQIAPLGFEIDTAALQGASKAANQAADALDKMGKAAGDAAAKAKQAGKETKAAGDEMGGVAKGAGAAGAGVRQLQEILRRSQETFAGSSGHVERLTGSLGNLANAVGGGGGTRGLTGSLSSGASMLSRFASTLGPVGGLVAGVGGGIVALAGAYVGLNAALAPAQERFALLEARLKNVYGSAVTAKAVFADIKVLADKNAISIDQAAEAYLRLARNNQAIGLSRKEMLQLTDAVQMLGRVSGASTGELASGMLQFSQALASGRLNGDELRSVMENMPALAKAIADGMKISVGQLRAMGAEGQLTGDKITKALLGQLPAIQKEFEGLPQTSEQAFTRVENAWTDMLSRMGKRLEASGFMSWMAKQTEDLIRATDRAINGVSTEGRIDQLRSMLKAPSITPYQDFLQEQNRKELRNLQYQGWAANQNARGKAEADLLEDQARRPRASFEAAKGMLQELDPARKRVQELSNNLNTLQGIWADFQRNPKLFKPEDEEQLKRLPGYINMLTRQLQQAGSAFEQFQRNTRNRISDAIKYGYQASGFGADVRKVMDGPPGADGRPVSESAAVGLVTQDRIVSINGATAAIEQQVAAEKARTAAIGQGKQAEREAEASAKAYAYQLETFGTQVGPDVTAAVLAYKNALLGLSSAQDASAQKQSILNASIDMAGARAGAAALAAGGGSGAVEAARRRARRSAEIAATGDASLGIRYAAEDLDRLTNEGQQLRTMRGGTAATLGMLGLSPAAARRAQQERDARQFSDGFSTDGQRDLAYQTKLADLRAQDRLTAHQQLEDKVQSAALTKQEIELTKIGGIAGQVAVARAREMNAIRQSGLELGKDEIEQRLQLAEQAVIDQDALSKAQRAANSYVEMWSNAGDMVKSSLEGVFDQLFDGERLKWKDLLSQMAKDLAMILLRGQTSKIGNLFGDYGAGGLGSLFGSSMSSIYGLGGVNSGGYNVMSFGNGTLLNKPTMFPMARGAGLAGEAGPEAILPLKRGPDGKLGVGSGARGDGGVSVVVNDMRSGGEQVQTQEDRGPDGKRLIRLTIRDEVKSQIKNGNFDPEMSSQYGAKRMLARR